MIIWQARANFYNIDSLINMLMILISILSFVTSICLTCWQEEYWHCEIYTRRKRQKFQTQVDISASVFVLLLRPLQAAGVVENSRSCNIFSLVLLRCERIRFSIFNNNVCCSIIPNYFYIFVSLYIRCYNIVFIQHLALLSSMEG